MFQTYLRDRLDAHQRSNMSDDTHPMKHDRRPSPAPWHTDGATQEMPQEEGPTRYATYVWSSADDRLVAVAMGDTAAEAQANALLFVELSRGLAAAEAAKAQGQPLPGETLRILVDEPSGAELNRGDVVRVIADPDANNVQLVNNPKPGKVQQLSTAKVGEASVWVQDPGGTQWGLDPAARGLDWVVIPRDS